MCVVLVLVAGVGRVDLLRLLVLLQLLLLVLRRRRATAEAAAIIMRLHQAQKLPYGYGASGRVLCCQFG